MGEAPNILDVEVPSNTLAATFSKVPITGDSGHPVIIVINGQAVFLGTFDGSDTIPSLGGVESRGDITTTIAGLGSSSIPTIFTVSSTQKYPSTNRTELLQVIAGATNKGTKYPSMNRTELYQIIAGNFN